MSTLAAARADNFYNPPNWNPNEISRDKYQGSKGHNQYVQKGLIRFEMPFPIFCNNCNKHIDKGVRFNAKKDPIGYYLSTKLWEFSMRCYQCGNMIRIQTDPALCDYKIVEGAKRQSLSYNHYTESELEVMKVYEEAHKERLENDTIYRLEHEHKEQQRLKAEHTRLERLQNLQERDKHDYDNNQILRKLLREKKRKQEALNVTANRKGLDVKLLEINERDRKLASKIEFKRKYKKTNINTNNNNSNSNHNSNNNSNNNNSNNNNNNNNEKEKEKMKSDQINDYIAANVDVIGNNNISTNTQNEIKSASQILRRQRLKVKNESIFKRKYKQQQQRNKSKIKISTEKDKEKLKPNSNHNNSILFKNRLNKKKTLSALALQYQQANSNPIRSSTISSSSSSSSSSSLSSSGLFGLNNRSGFGLCGVGALHIVKKKKPKG